MITSELLEKYDTPVPRYTSYPTVPYWCHEPSTQDWLQALSRALDAPESRWALYLHLPFCENLCTYCGCNTVITRDHAREETYIKHIHTEWELYKKAAPALLQRALRQVHLGGGTPTFFSPENLTALLKPMLDEATLTGGVFDGAVEVDPRVTKREHLEALRALGFSRVSMGVQDFDANVQHLVNRYQPQDITTNLTREARALGYDSVNYDLIYGLPQQTPETITRTAQITAELRPDRIALYSFAKVPWIKPQQRRFKDDDLPEGADKRALYELARDVLLKNGYREIGMDHFALPNDSLYLAEQSGELHRNFNGYTDLRSEVLLGLGVSAISEAPTCFHQNEKIFKQYDRRVEAGELPTLRGHLLDAEDRAQREQILKLMTQFEVELRDQEQVEDAREFLSELIDDGIVTLEGRLLKLTPEGRPFLRNVAVFFDYRLRRDQPETQVFSHSL